MNYIELFHGMSEDSLRKPAHYFARREVGRLVRLHLTDSIGVARYYAASRAWERGGFGKHDPRGVVLTVHVKTSDLRADRRAYAICNDQLRAEGEHAVRPPPVRDWKTSLEELGSVIHTGNIPASDIAIVEYVRPGERKRIDDDRPMVRCLAL